MVREFLIVALAGCFSPDVRDCTVTCTNDVECAGSQRCGADHFCAAPERAGQCGAAAADGGIDASIPTDAGMVASPPDARSDAAMIMMVPLHVHIDGQGTVAIEGGASCTTGPAPKADCMLQVPANVALTLTATPMGDSDFQQWSMACTGTMSTCMLVPAKPTDVGARFSKDGGS